MNGFMEKITQEAFEDELQKIAGLKDITRAIGRHLPGGEQRHLDRLIRSFTDTAVEGHFIPEAVKRHKKYVEGLRQFYPGFKYQRGLRSNKITMEQ
jgi:hypothetical protein